MNTLSNKTGGFQVAAALTGVLCAASAVAQQPLDTRSLAPTRVQAASCADVAWDRDLLSQYPRLAEGCQEVVVSEGVKWARFEAEFVTRNRDGSVTLDFQNRAGESIEVLTLMPAADQRVIINGRPARFSDLVRDQSVNLYVPEGVFAVAAEPGAPTEQLAQIVREPVQLAQAEPTPRLAQAAPVEQRRLPSTAGPLPLFLLGGLASLLSGLALTMKRRRAAK